MQHDEWPDDALYKGIVQRDARALEALIRRYSREMSYFIRVVLGGGCSPQDAEECTSDLFLIVWEEVGSFDPARASLRTWLTMRAKYIALDRRRQVQRRQGPVTSLDDPGKGMSGENRSPGMPIPQLADENMEGLIEQRERREELGRALDSLPSLDRYLVYMRYLHLATTEEISSKTGLTRHAIDTRLWRARKALRVILEERSHERVRAH